jgi:ABC-type sugar transport system permease subunit/maltose-binding protein MalE
VLFNRLLNKALLRRAGLVWQPEEEAVRSGRAKAGEARPPQNWKELKEYALKLTRKDPQGNIKTLGFAPNYGNVSLYFYAWMNGAEYMSQDRKTVMLNSPEIVEALEYVVDIYDALGGVQGVLAFQQSLQQGPLDPFLNGQVAMKIDGNWFLDAICAFKPEMDVLVAPAPLPQRRIDAGADPVSWSGGYAFAIPRTARNPEASWALIRTMVSKKAEIMSHERRAQQAHSQGRVYVARYSPNKKTSEEIFRKYITGANDIPDAIKTAYRQFLDLLPYSKFRPVTPVGQRLWQEQVNAMEAALFHKCSPAEALTAGTQIVQRDLDDVLTQPAGTSIQWPIVITLYIAAIAIGYAFIWRHGSRNKAKGIFRQELREGTLCASPWIMGFVIFGGGPMIFSLIISFCSYDVLHPAVFTGFENYRIMFCSDAAFYKALKNTLYMLIGLPISLSLGLGIALLLNHELKGISAYRTAFYLPAVMPMIASSLLWIWMFDPNRGLLNMALGLLGIAGPSWLQDELWAKPALIIMGLWGVGGGMVIWLGGLKSIPESLYEAAAIDGAGPIRQFFSITLPMLSPYIFFNMIMGMIGTFQIFEQAYVMTSGGPVDSTLFYAYKLFNEAFRYLRMGYASAMAWILLVIILTLTLINMRYSKRWVHYQGD